MMDIALDLLSNDPALQMRSAGTDPSDLPVPRLATPPAAPLFDSSRDYVDQIDHYRRWQGVA